MFFYGEIHELYIKLYISNVRWDSLDMVTYPVVDGADAAQVRL